MTSHYDNVDMKPLNKTPIAMNHDEVTKKRIAHCNYRWKLHWKAI